MPKKPVAIDHARYIPALLNSVANKLATGASNTYRRRFGVGVTEWRILSLLATEPHCSALRICEFFDLDKALVSRTLATMTAARLIAATGQNRGRKIGLTPKGRALHDRIIRVALDRERRLLSGFSIDEVATLSNFLNRLLVGVKIVNADDAKVRRAEVAAPASRKTGVANPRKATPSRSPITANRRRAAS